jgi:hypothetical protein
MTNDQMTKKYILKPGKHQFAPKSAAIHDNDNLTDKEAKYPHIKSLFEQIPPRRYSKAKKSEATI